MYGFIKGISMLIRLFVLPNPFGPLDGRMLFGYLINAFILNLSFEPVLNAIAYSAVGTIYQRGSAPAIGAILYAAVYSLFTMIVYVMVWTLALLR